MPIVSSWMPSPIGSFIFDVAILRKHSFNRNSVGLVATGKRTTTTAAMAPPPPPLRQATALVVPKCRFRLKKMNYGKFKAWSNCVFSIDNNSWFREQDCANIVSIFKILKIWTTKSVFQRDREMNLKNISSASSLAGPTGPIGGYKWLSGKRGRITMADIFVASFLTLSFHIG